MSQPTDPTTAIFQAIAAYGDAQRRAGVALGAGVINRREEHAYVEQTRNTLHDLIRSLTVYDPTGLHRLVDELLARRAEYAAGDRTQHRAAVEAAQQLAAAGRRAEVELAIALQDTYETAGPKRSGR